MKESMEEDMETYDNEPPFTDIAILRLLKSICNELLYDNVVRAEMIETINECIEHLLVDGLIGYLVDKKMKEKEMSEEQGDERKNEGLNALLLLKGLLNRRLLKRLRR